MLPKQHRILFVLTAIVLRLAIYAYMLFKMYIVLALPMAILLTVAELVVLAIVWRLLGWNEPKTSATTAELPMTASISQALSHTAAAPNGAAPRTDFAAPRTQLVEDAPNAPVAERAPTAPAAPSAPVAPTTAPAPIAPITPPSLAELTAPFTKPAPAARTRDTTAAAVELADALDRVAAVAQPAAGRIVRPLPSWQPPALPTFAPARDEQLTSV